MTSPRAVLHVGLPKTGTSFLQGVLRGNTEVLEQHGVRLPEAASKGQQLFLAVLYVTERSETWGRSADAGRRAWERLAADVRRRGGTTVISSETLCLATDEQIRRILADLGAVPGDVQVDVVVTVRDPARQVPAEYQEGVKHGRRMSYPKFLETVLGEETAGGDTRRSTRRRFWNAQDPVAVLDRWAAHVGPEHCHVVTCPPPGAEPTVLWGRMARVLGVEDVAVEMPPREVNTSLGAVQIEVLRRLNRRVNRHGNERAYGDVVKRLYAGTILRGQAGERLRLPAEHADRVRDIARGWVDQLTARGYGVSGELADLVPAGGSDDDVPTRKGAARMLASSLDATADLLREIERLREENTRLRGGSEGSRLRRRNPLKVGSGGRL